MSVSGYVVEREQESLGIGNDMEILFRFCLARSSVHPHRIYSIEVAGSRRLNNSDLAFRAVSNEITKAIDEAITDFTYGIGSFTIYICDQSIKISIAMKTRLN